MLDILHLLGGSTVWSRLHSHKFRINETRAHLEIQDTWTHEYTTTYLPLQEHPRGGLLFSYDDRPND
jgi:hypothetical protein